MFACACLKQFTCLRVRVKRALEMDLHTVAGISEEQDASLMLGRVGLDVE